MIRVLLAGDVRLYRDGLAEYLEKREGITVVGAAGSVLRALTLANEVSPDIAVVDLAMPDSLRLAHQLATLDEPVRVVTLGVPEREEAVIACAEAGVAGYVLRDARLEDLDAAIRRATRDEMLLSPRMASVLVRRVAALSSELPDSSPAGSLTAREREVIRLIDEGLSNKQIAVRLSIELATVKNHVHHILEKLEVHRRGDAVRTWRRARSRV